MDDKRRKTISKFMSRVLRHKPQNIGITIEYNGAWADTSALLEGMNKTGFKVTLDEIKEVVATNDKQRFKFSDEFYTKIRANQGHSIDVDLGYEPAEPPFLLYHGTAGKFIGSIKSEGLIAKTRQHVHLSADKETALKVGRRHGSPVILTINSAKMHEDGFRFYLSDNGVWLTDKVPVEYIWQF